MQSESSSSSINDNIPVLYKRPIDQKQKFKPEDLQFDINFDKLIAQAKIKKDPHYVVIKTLHIKKKELLVSYQKLPLKRIMHLLGPSSQQKFISINFDIYKTQKYYAKQLLKQEIVINKEKYAFFGYSKSSLKSFSCFFYKGSESEISKIFEELGNFNQIYEISKKAARLSLLYSDARIALNLVDKQIQVIDDVQRDGVCFTDGCGYLSLDLARKIKRYLTTESKDQMDYLPAVYQVRIKGIKGIVVINPEYEGDQLIARRSMQKFKAKPNKLNELIVISHSKPSSYASINQQIIMLLDGLGIEPQYFLQLQKNYLKLLRKAIQSPMSHIDLLMYLGEDEKIQQLLKNETNQKKKESIVRSIVSEQIFRNIRSKDMKNRLKIPLSNARFLYGAVYPELFNNKNTKIKLLKNQVFLRVTTSKGVVQTIVGKVIVTKNPCYYCGDVRILQAVDVPQESIPFAKKLVDVIIFSTEGQMPIGSTMAGSDYDGDQYFVCWDQKLIPKKQVKPYHYPASKPKTQKQPVTQHQLINYLVNFDRFIVSRINARYLQFATHSRQGAHCPQCIELGTQLFSRAIDSANTGDRVIMPEYLNCFVYEQSMDGEQVWIEMAKEYQVFFDEQFSLDSGLTSGWKVKYKSMEDFVRSYVQSKQYSEYQLFKIIKSWYISTKQTKYDLFQYVDFTQLQTKQKRQTKDLPNFPQKYFGNPFDRSNIFSHYLFQQNGIQFHSYQQAPKKWRHYYSASGDQIDFNLLSEALTVFNNVLFGIKVMKDVFIVFSVTQMKKKCYSQNYFPNESFKAYYVGFGQFERFHETNLEQKEYKLFYDDDLLQIYQKQKGNSFIKIWFQSEIVSIDLSRFDRSLLRRHKINKQPIQSLQIYVGLSENYKKVQTKKLYVTQSTKYNDGFKRNNKNRPYGGKEKNYEEEYFSGKQSSRYWQDSRGFREGSKKQWKEANKLKKEEMKFQNEAQKLVKKIQYVEKKPESKQDNNDAKGQTALDKVLSNFLDKF